MSGEAFAWASRVWHPVRALRTAETPRPGLHTIVKTRTRRGVTSGAKVLNHNLGLVPALQELAEGIRERNRVSVEVEGGSGGRLPGRVEIALYRVVQEALNNAVRHGAAKQVKVRVWYGGKRVSCSIKDDGVGFDVDALLSRRGRRGLGLIGMQERVAALHGEWRIKSSPGRGTEILVCVPRASNHRQALPSQV